jgi:hypothetical protein
MEEPDAGSGDFDLSFLDDVGRLADDKEPAASPPRTPTNVIKEEANASDPEDEGHGDDDYEDDDLGSGTGKLSEFTEKADRL